MSKRPPATPELVRRIRENENGLQNKTVTAGFDGFIDTIVRIIKDKKEGAPSTYFSHKHEFANYILEKEGASFSVEMEQLGIKLGGNMPIMANALGRIGINVNCIGALGYPHVHPVFETFPARCRFYSFADPGTSTNVEFEDGKILMGNMGELNTSGWSVIKDRIGIDTLINLYSQSDLLSIVNWSEIDASTNIWKGILSDILPRYQAKHRQIAFFDLSDCSKRSREVIREALDLIPEFSQHARVIVGLNKNEAGLIHHAFFDTAPGDDLEQTGKSIFERLPVDTLLLHSSRQATAINSSGVYTADTFFVSQPLLSTGAGDNFNAGFVSGLLLNLDIEDAITVANAVAALYISTGISPQISDVTHFLEQLMLT